MDTWRGQLLPIVLLLLFGGPAIDTAAAQASLSRTFSQVRDLPGRYHAEVRYPVFESADYLNVNAVLLSAISEAERDFLDSMPKDHWPESASYPWEFSVSYEIVWNSDHALSVLFSFYEYTGGAHPNHWTKSFLFLRESGGFREVGLDSVIAAESAARFVDLVVGDLRRQGAALAVGDELELAGLDDLDTFTVDPSGISILFDPYEVGPYAQGDFVVHLPMEAIEELLSPGFRRNRDEAVP